MKLSINFVKDYVDIDTDVKTLAEDMTKAGNEYDSAGKLLNATKLVVGEVKECNMHPDSDHRKGRGRRILPKQCLPPLLSPG